MDKIFTTAVAHCESIIANWLHWMWNTTMTSRATSRTRPCQPASRAVIWSPALAVWWTQAICYYWRPVSVPRSPGTDWVSVPSAERSMTIVAQFTDMKFYIRKLYVSFCSKWYGNTWGSPPIYSDRTGHAIVGQCLWQWNSELRCICLSIVRCSRLCDTRCFTWIIQRFIGIQFKWRGNVLPSTFFLSFYFWRRFMRAKLIVNWIFRTRI